MTLLTNWALSSENEQNIYKNPLKCPCNPPILFLYINSKNKKKTISEDYFTSCFCIISVIKNGIKVIKELYRDWDAFLAWGYVHNSSSNSGRTYGTLSISESDVWTQSQI